MFSLPQLRRSSRSAEPRSRESAATAVSRQANEPDGIQMSPAVRGGQNEPNESKAKKENDIFEQQANNVKYFALSVAMSQKLSRVVALMAVTWATAVLLGGFVGKLLFWDFYLISALLLLQSLRLFVIDMFTKMISFIHFQEHRDPTEFKFTDKQPRLQSRVSLVGSAFGGLLALTCLAGPCIRFRYVSSHPFESHKNNNDNSNLIPSIFIFYILVLITSAIAVVSFLLHVLALQYIQKSNRGSYDNSLATFYNTIYKTAIDDSIAQAEDLQLLEFGFEKVAGELKRNIRHQRVRALNSGMLRFMYEDVGITTACVHMRSDGPWKVTTAVNLPGFWTEEQKIETKHDLFWRLRERMCSAGKDAIGALNSVTSLARHWSEKAQTGHEHPFLLRNPVDQGNVMDILVDLVLMPSRSSVVFRVRAFEACCRDSRIRDYLYKSNAPPRAEPTIPEKEIISRRIQSRIRGVLKDGDGQAQTHENVKLTNLCMKLADFVQASGNMRKVTKYYCAGALLSLLTHGDYHLDEEFKIWLSTIIKRQIIPPSSGYILKDDIALAEKVRKWFNLAQLAWGDVINPDEDGAPAFPPQVIRDFLEAVTTANA